MYLVNHCDAMASAAVATGVIHRCGVLNERNSGLPPFDNDEDKAVLPVFEDVLSQSSRPGATIGLNIRLFAMRVGYNAIRIPFAFENAQVSPRDFQRGCTIMVYMSRV